MPWWPVAIGKLLCSPVCRTGLQRGKPVITFQQGVIGTILDVPVTASKYVAFGQPSASLMAQLNRRFFQAAEMPEPSVEYVPGGCLFDTVTALPDQFDHQTLLMVDVPVVQVTSTAWKARAGRCCNWPRDCWPRTCRCAAW